MAFHELEAACGRPPLSFLEGPYWLVGGCVRDVLLGRPVVDWDILVESDAPGVARALADRWGGSFVPLDEERSIHRVVGRDRLVVDVCEIGEGTLESDLRRRDFTVNAMAFGPEGLVDPLGGRVDLETRRLRTCSERSLPEDPLRVLRAFRFVVELGMALGPGLEEELRSHSPSLKGVARERSRDEFLRILKAGFASVAALMQRCGALVILPFFGRVPHVPVPLATLQRLERASLPSWLAEHLEQPVAGGRRRRELLRLASLYCRWGEESPAEALVRALALGRQELLYLSRLLLPREGPQPRYDLYRQLQDALPDYALLVECAHPSRAEETRQWLDDYASRSRLVFPPRFLNGHDLQELGFPPGPGLGHVLEQLERAAALAEIDSREEALALARQALRGQGNPQPVEKVDGP